MAGCSFTGHRFIKNSHTLAIRPLIRRAIEYAYAEGHRDFMSGGAIGFDTLVALELILARAEHPDLRIVLMLPCKNQSEKWTPVQKSLYKEILAAADEIIYVSKNYTPSCMKERNMLLAKSCDMLIAYLGSDSSGTAQTVAMARRLGKKIYNLYPTLDKEEKGSEQY